LRALDGDACVALRRRGLPHDDAYDELLPSPRRAPDGDDAVTGLRVPCALDACGGAVRGLTCGIGDGVVLLRPWCVYVPWMISSPSRLLREYLYRKELFA
jgi:hypothetical protein